MKTQIAVITAILAGAGTVVNVAANAATVTPPPAIARAMATVTHRYCQMVATNKQHYPMQHRLKVLGHKTTIRTGISWPLVLDFKETCEPTKAALRAYKAANRPFVVAVRNRYRVPVWTTREAFDFCAKREGVKGRAATEFGQYSRIIYHCFPHKK